MSLSSFPVFSQVHNHWGRKLVLGGNIIGLRKHIRDSGKNISDSGNNKEVLGKKEIESASLHSYYINKRARYVQIISRSLEVFFFSFLVKNLR